MRFVAFLAAALFALAGTAAWALTADEVIKLKNAGVSDATIQKMLEQEQVQQNQSPIKDQGGEVVYSAGENTAKDAADNAAHERWKERKSMEVLQGTVIDTRNQQPVTNQSTGNGK